jgi:hypothetical protein
MCDHLFVVSDNMGFVGAFDASDAANALVQEHHQTPFIVQKFRTAPGPVESVWVVPLRELDHVAFVSNSKEEATRVLQIYQKVGLAHEDEIDYWEQPINTVVPHAKERLTSRTRAHNMYAGESAPDPEKLRESENEDLARADRMSRPIEDGPIARMLQMSERITIMDCLVDVAERVDGATQKDSGSAPAADIDEPADQDVIVSHE